jgi:putative ABC transport system substrate-binding protein
MKKGILFCMLAATIIFTGAYLYIASRTSQLKTITIGIVNPTLALEPVLDGFKAGMTKLGYMEGKNISYIYHGPTESIKALGPAIQELIEAKVDLIFSASTPATIQAHQSTEGTGIPVVFGPVNDPVKSGIVGSLRNPGGMVTGVMASSAVFVPKGLEWLLAVAPDTKRIFVPHNPNDKSSVIGLNALQKAADAYRVELIVREIYNPEEVAAISEYITEDVDAVFLLPDNLILTRTNDLIKITHERTLPLASSIYPHTKAGALMGYGFESASIGKQAARIAHQVLNGARPTDLPVETCEFFLGINLKTALTIGLDIPDEILRQADHIVR